MTKTATNGPAYKAGNTPVWSLVTAVMLVGFAVVTLVFADFDDERTPYIVMVLGLIVTTVPSLISSVFAERASRDIRNGVVVEKTREGATEALHETGVSNVANVNPAAIEAITRILIEREDEVSAAARTTRKENDNG